MDLKKQIGVHFANVRRRSVGRKKFALEKRQNLESRFRKIRCAVSVGRNRATKVHMENVHLVLRKTVIENAQLAKNYFSLKDQLRVAVVAIKKVRGQCGQLPLPGFLRLESGGNKFSFEIFKLSTAL